MRAQNKQSFSTNKPTSQITYSPDVDILMIQLSNKKIDDSYETDNMIVQVDQEGEPVLIEIFHGLTYLKDLSRTLPKNVQKELWSQTPPSVAHRIK